MRIGPIGIAVVTVGSFVAGQAADDREKQQTYAEGGQVRLSLSSGDYILRAGASDRIVVRWKADGEAGAKELQDLSVDLHVAGTRAHASVTFGDLEARPRPLGISKGGVKRSLDWTAAGPYALDARVFAGDLTSTHQR